MDAVCYAVPRRARSLSLRSRLVVSRFGRATRVAETVSRSALRFLRAKHVRLVPQPSRDDVARALCGDCYVGGTLLPAWTFTSGIESPAFTMAASERERFAAGGSVLLPVWPARVPHSTSNVSHRRRGFAKLVERRRGLSSRHRRHASDNRDERKARVATVRHTRVSHTRHT